MKVDRRGVAFVAGFEGYAARPYRDGGGIWTIGYGHTGADVFKLSPLSQQGALVVLGRDLLIAERAVNALGRQWTQPQFDALVSIVFNCGAGILSTGHTLGNAIRGGNLAAIAASFRVYVHDALGNVELGLVRRRDAEANLFLSSAANPYAHRLAVWRAELAHRRRQLRAARAAGTRHYLRRRIHALEHVISEDRTKEKIG